MRVSRRGAVAPFHAMEVLKAANAAEAAGKTVIHMEVGEPTSGAPAKVREAAREAVSNIHLGYTEALGVPELRARIVRHYAERYGVEIPGARIAVTTGSSGGFLLTFLSAFDPGERIALATPSYPAYRNILSCPGLEPVLLAAGPETRFQLSPALLEAAGGNIAGLLVASPANPTGCMMQPAAFEEIIAYCADRRIRFISDEIYHGITYERGAETALAFDENAVVVNSFSKYFCMTGWRLGWMVVPEDLARSVERLAQNVFISPPALSQHAAVHAFDCGDELDANVARYKRNRARLLTDLPRAGFGDIAPADGAFYIFADVSGLTGDSVEFCRRMLDEAGVAATPGIDFDLERGHRTIRLCFAGTAKDIDEAAGRLGSWLG